MRAWGGLRDVTPDGSPIMGLTDVAGFLVDGGWGPDGFGATPAVGAAMADLVHDGAVPDHDRALRPRSVPARRPRP